MFNLGGLEVAVLGLAVALMAGLAVLIVWGDGKKGGTGGGPPPAAPGPRTIRDADAVPHAPGNGVIRDYTRWL
jgi:hypothetical protein